MRSVLRTDFRRAAMVFERMESDALIAATTLSSSAAYSSCSVGFSALKSSGSGEGSFSSGVFNCVPGEAWGACDWRRGTMLPARRVAWQFCKAIRASSMVGVTACHVKA